MQAADAISAARPGARRETLESYIKRLESLEKIAESKKGVEKCYAMQAGREVRVMVKPAEIDDDEAALLAREIAKEIEEQLEYPGQIKVTVIRESRAVDTPSSAAADARRRIWARGGAMTDTYYPARSFGCQMNEHDSERIRARARERGPGRVATPDEAAVLVYNTCTVRQSADERLAGHLGHRGPAQT